MMSPGRRDCTECPDLTHDGVNLVLERSHISYMLTFSVRDMPCPESNLGTLNSPVNIKYFKNLE
jgi:hypothetical protein